MAVDIRASRKQDFIGGGKRIIIIEAQRTELKAPQKKRYSGHV
jgi:hypothetical protein